MEKRETDGRLDKYSMRAKPAVLQSVGKSNVTMSNRETTVARNIRFVRVLICLMFLTFAMTSDAVGSVIPLVIAEFGASMKAAGAFHYVPMMAMACGALLLGFMADRLGRKLTIVLGQTRKVK